MTDSDIGSSAIGRTAVAGVVNSSAVRSSVGSVVGLMSIKGPERDKQGEELLNHGLQGGGEDFIRYDDDDWTDYLSRALRGVDDYQYLIDRAVLAAVRHPGRHEWRAGNVQIPGNYGYTGTYLLGATLAFVKARALKQRSSDGSFVVIVSTNITDESDPRGVADWAKYYLSKGVTLGQSEVFHTEIGWTTKFKVLISGGVAKISGRLYLTHTVPADFGDQS
jgi:hypothetical protein